MKSKALIGVTMYITYLISPNFHYMADILSTRLKSHNNQSINQSRAAAAMAVRAVTSHDEG